MNRIVRSHRKEELMEGYEGDTPFDRGSEPSPHANRFKLPPWLAGAICIFAVLYGTSYLALFWLPPYKGVDMRSQLAADYSAWAFLVFQPVDPAIIEEIRQERGLPEQLVVDGLFWPTPASTLTILQTTRHTPTSTPQATFDNLSSSPTSFQPPYTSTPMPTSIISLPEPTVTLKPAETLIPTSTLNPTKTSKPHKTPKPRKTPRPP